MVTPTPAEIAQSETTLQGLAAQRSVAVAMQRLLDYRNSYRPTSNPRFWAVINFDLPSSQERLYLFDRQLNQSGSYLCAHGKGSDRRHTGMATRFSNVDESHCSSLGIYRTGDTYFGEHGRSLYLDGLEETNFNARHRHIVMHAASYVSPQFVARHGKTGRSLGCPAVDPQHVQSLIDSLRGGSLIIAWKSGT